MIKFAASDVSGFEIMRLAVAEYRRIVAFSSICTSRTSASAKQPSTTREKLSAGKQLGAGNHDIADVGRGRDWDNVNRSLDCLPVFWSSACSERYALDNRLGCVKHRYVV